MKTRRCLAVLWILPLTGCGQQLIGKWSASDAPNARAACQFQSMEFKNDKTFTATATVQGKVTQMAGKWSYDGMKLKIDADSGRKRQYDAVVWWGKTLEVTDKEGDTTIKQRFNKG